MDLLHGTGLRLEVDTVLYSADLPDAAVPYLLWIASLRFFRGARLRLPRRFGRPPCTIERHTRNRYCILVLLQ